MAPTKSKKPDYSSLRHLFKPHVESFDYFIDKGVELALTSIRPVEMADGNTKLRIYYGEPRLLPPRNASANRNIYPQECREARTTYKGDFSVGVFFQYNDGPSIRHRLSFGQLPIMLMSKRCHLRGADPPKLIYRKEEATEMGGQ